MTGLALTYFNSATSIQFWIGLAMLASVGIAAFFEQFIWPVILLALVLLMLAIFRERHRLRQHRKNASQGN